MQTTWASENYRLQIYCCCVATVASWQLDRYWIGLIGNHQTLLLLCGNNWIVVLVWQQLIWMNWQLFDHLSVMYFPRVAPPSWLTHYHSEKEEEFFLPTDLVWSRFIICKFWMFSFEKLKILKLQQVFVVFRAGAFSNQGWVISQICR